MDHIVIQIMRIIMPFHGQYCIAILYLLFWSLFFVNVQQSTHIILPRNGSKKNKKGKKEKSKF